MHISFSRCFSQWLLFLQFREVDKSKDIGNQKTTGVKPKTIGIERLSSKINLPKFFLF